MATKQPRSSTLTTALLYTRVSSDEQAREGVSLDVQLREDRQYVARQPGWVIGGEYQDVMSGTRDDRPDYQALLAEARRLRATGQPAVVVVAALDRFGRKLLERVRCREELKVLGVPVHSVREGGEVSDLVANILASVAQEEVRLLGERVRGAKQHLQAHGWFAGGRVPWGYRLRDATPEERAQGAPQRVLDVDPVIAPYVREAFARLAAGASLRAVARWVLSLPEPLRQGRVLSYVGVRKLLARPTYAGLMSPEGPPARWPALVDVHTWTQAQTRVAAHQHVPRQASGRYVLTGLLRCSRCGARMRGALRVPRGRRYVCAGNEVGTCSYSLQASVADAVVLDEATRLVEAITQHSADFQAALRRAWRTLQHTDGGPPPAAPRKSLQSLAEQARQRLTRAAVLYADGEIDKVGYELLRDKARADLDAATAELERLAPAAPAPTLPPLDTVLRQAGGWAQILTSTDVAAQRAVLAELVDHVIPERIARGQYATRIRWTPQGQALRQAAAAVTPAA